MKSMISSNLRFDRSIPVGTIFGVDRDRYCCHMFWKGDLRDVLIGPWQMWQRVSANVVACKFCRLYADSRNIHHECGWWERTENIDGLICFCSYHDDLGYVLNDGDLCMFCSSAKRSKKDILPYMWRLGLLRANSLQVYIMGGQPEFRLSYHACRDGSLILPEYDTVPLLPSQVLSVRAFSKFIREYKTFKAKAQIYRGTTLGQFMTMQSKRDFQTCSKSLWLLVGVNDLSIVMHLEQLRSRATARS